MNSLVTGDELYEFAKQVSSKADFDHFLKCLAEDLKTNPREWENKDLLRYLQAIAAFAESADGYYKNVGEPVDTERFSWRLVSQILLAGSVHGN